MAKGGAKHFMKPYVDAGLLLQELQKHREIIADFGSYETISRSQALNPKSMMQSLPLIKGLLKLQPSGEIHSSSLRSGLFNLLMADPALNTTRFNGQVWVNLRIERVTNLLYHFRRLKQGDDLRVCASHLTSPELLELKKALELLGAKPEPEPSQCLALVPLDKSETEMVGTSSRSLKATVSDVSLDSDGFPACLKEPASSSTDCRTPLPKGHGEGRIPAFMRCRPGRRVAAHPLGEPHLAIQMGFCAAESLPKAMAKKKKKKGKACKKLGPRTACLKAVAKVKAAAGRGKVAWENLRITKAKKPERAYITGTLAKGQKRKLVVEVRELPEPHRGHIPQTARGRPHQGGSP